MTRQIENVRLIYDMDHGPENQGWYTRHDERRGDDTAAALDNALDCTDQDAVETALDEAVAYFGGRVSREDIEVVR